MSSEKELEYSDNPDFNLSINDDVGEIDIFGEKFSPSRILYDHKKETYRVALTEFNERQFEELQQLVFDSYPALIAYNYRLSVRGPGANDPVKKFLHLKDAWEGAINVLYALAFGEIRAKNINLKAANVNHSGNPNLHFNAKVIRTDKLKQRLENIKAIVNFSKTSSLGLKSEHISIPALDNLYDLQDNRNHFSHTSTPTKEQAEKGIQIVQPLVEKVLGELRFLENVNIVRFESFTTTCRFETFKGHYLNKEYEETDIPSEELSYVMTNPGEEIFAHWEDDVFSLLPFLHFVNDGTGHETYLCFYKGKKKHKYWYEPLKIRNEVVFDLLHDQFDLALQELCDLMVP
jgi:hypothetical protein